jgi:hypothetical protein
VKHSDGHAIWADGGKLHELEREVLDLKITNRAKDMFIEQLKNERLDFFDKFLQLNQPSGQIDQKSQQLIAPKK